MRVKIGGRFGTDTDVNTLTTWRQVRCPGCLELKDVEQLEGAMNIKVHGTYTLGAKKPFKMCKGSGRVVTVHS